MEVLELQPLIHLSQLLLTWIPGMFQAPPASFLDLHHVVSGSALPSTSSQSWFFPKTLKVSPVHV